MVGICIELKTSCKQCSAALMLNAFTEDIICRSCNKTNTFSQETWQGLLEDAVKKAPKFKLGEGQPSTIFRGEYNYSLVYGRQEPRCGKCKEGIDVSKIEEYSSQHSVTCAKCSNNIFVRKSSELVTKCFGGVKYLVGEDDDQLSVNKSGKAPASSKPILFTCPSCAGNLKIDGSNRMVDCQFCDSQIYLPDDLWFRLHPPKTVERWYILLNWAGSPQTKSGSGAPIIEEAEPMPEWHYFSDITIDKNGNMYAAGTEDDSDDFIVWSVGADLKMRWVRRDLKFDYDNTGLTITNDGNLYLWNKHKHSLLKLSSKDGSTIQKMEGKAATKENPDTFNMKGCGTLVSDKDGTMLALIENTAVRYSPQGERIQLWSGKKWGLFSAGIGLPVTENPEWAPCVKEIGSFFKRADSNYTKLNMGWDGYIYAMDKSSNDGELAKYAADGTQLWSKLTPLRYKECKPCADSHGNVYILGTDENSNTNLVKYNPSNDKFETLLKDIVDGGVLNDEEHLAVSPGGTAFILNTYSGMKVFSPDMKMIYRSKSSEDDDNDALDELKKKKEKDEEFS